MKINIYQRAIKKGCFLECTCVNISIYKWEALMKGARDKNCFIGRCNIFR